MRLIWVIALSLLASCAVQRGNHEDIPLKNLPKEICEKYCLKCSVADDSRFNGNRIISLYFAINRHLKKEDFKVLAINICEEYLRARTSKVNLSFVERAVLMDEFILGITSLAPDGSYLKEPLTEVSCINGMIRYKKYIPERNSLEVYESEDYEVARREFLKLKENSKLYFL